jgi:AraC-like DNA-binding protein
MIQVLFEIAAFQSLVLFGVFIFKRAFKVCSHFLAIIFLVFFWLCFVKAFGSIDFYIDFPFLIRSDWGLPLLLLPLAFLYIKYLLLPTDNFSWRDLIHFWPYALNLTILIPFFILPPEQKIYTLNYYTPFITRGFDSYSGYFTLIPIAVFLQTGFYSLSINTLITRYRKSMLDILSSKKSIEVNLFYFVLIGMALLSGVYMATSLLSLSTQYLDIDYQNLYYVGVFLLVLILSFNAINISANPEVQAERNLILNEQKPAYSGSTLTEEKSQELACKLRTMLKDQKLFLNSELNSIEVAHLIGTSRQYLSQVLNQQFSKSFYELINEYRIKEFIHLLGNKKLQHLSILGMAMECGFNSKSSFNKAFKQFTGMTPSAYLKIENNEGKN